MQQETKHRICLRVRYPHACNNICNFDHLHKVASYGIYMVILAHIILYKIKTLPLRTSSHDMSKYVIHSRVPFCKAYSTSSSHLRNQQNKCCRKHQPTVAQEDVLDVSCELFSQHVFDRHIFYQDRPLYCSIKKPPPTS